MATAAAPDKQADLQPGDRRYTIRTLAAGQPRPYADTIRHVRVTMEAVPYGGAPVWAPDPLTNDGMASDRLKGLQCGFTDRKAADCEWYDTRLDWLRMVAPGVWEFHTTSPFTD